MARCDTYTAGNCTAFVCGLLPWVPDGLGNAGDWLADAAAAGLSVGDTPIRGALAVWAPGAGYSEFGHVALVTAVHDGGTITVREMNFTGLGIEDYRTAITSSVTGFVYPPGDYDPGQGGDQGTGPPPAIGTIQDSWAGVAWQLNVGNPDAQASLLRLEQAVRSLPGGGG